MRNAELKKRCRSVGVRNWGLDAGYSILVAGCSCLIVHLKSQRSSNSAAYQHSKTISLGALPLCSLLYAPCPMLNHSASRISHSEFKNLCPMPIVFLFFRSPHSEFQIQSSVFDN
jgi:hypothetical protein